MPLMEVNGARLHVHSDGAGIPILFIHPPLLNQSIFAYQKERLADQFQVILFDIRGHGESDPSSRPVTYSLIADDAVSLLDRLRVDKAFIVGYSMGCTVALEALLRHPRRFCGAVLISGMPEANDWLVRSALKLGAKLASWRAKRLLAWTLSLGNADSKETYSRLYKHAMKGNAANIAEYFGNGLTYSCANRLSRIRHPVLLLAGGDDGLYLRYANRLHRGLPNATLQVLKDAPHQIPTKAAARLNGLIQCWILHMQASAEQGFWTRAEEDADTSAAMADECPQFEKQSDVNDTLKELNN